MIVLSGDIVDRQDSLPALETFLNELGPVQKIAVPGNWEYWSEVDFKTLAKLYARHQVEFLVNDCHVVHFGNRSLAFVGLDDALSGKPKLDKAQHRCEKDDTEGKILVEHSPGFFGAPLTAPIANPPYLLSLSGHTHGGQVTIFGSPIETPPGSGTYNRGWYDTRYGRLYISRGIGTTVVPLRVGSVPELTVFEVGLQ
ncbi:MAG: metallophosphoesterase [Gallionella sp.]|nr:metallophosphoesterase [Gallionella sp.]